jgi:hypothetical protein
MREAARINSENEITMPFNMQKRIITKKMESRVDAFNFENYCVTSISLGTIFRNKTLKKEAPERNIIDINLVGEIMKFVKK